MARYQNLKGRFDRALPLIQGRVLVGSLIGSMLGGRPQHAVRRELEYAKRPCQRSFSDLSRRKAHNTYLRGHVGVTKARHPAAADRPI
jgi:hypothetical protein